MTLAAALSHNYVTNVTLSSKRVTVKMRDLLASLVKKCAESLI